MGIISIAWHFKGCWSKNKKQIPFHQDMERERENRHHLSSWQAVPSVFSIIQTNFTSKRTDLIASIVILRIDIYSSFPFPTLFPSLRTENLSFYGSEFGYYIVTMYLICFKFNMRCQINHYLFYSNKSFWNNGLHFPHSLC